ncbi:MAG: DUF3786 domain-containing protein [Methanothrix sp.]|jgi:hypothetical protein|uniref:DUF3786 domain-containing protein n=1 Tax=Methanothrix sp. TaxID=90426 RepID=UPI0025E67C1C|nr:DUF3786 domain-containing protein [Methanothrix sp.]MCK9407083.1 DUF3786 domain-containing protein [Methanothrix sp.]
MGYDIALGMAWEELGGLGLPSSNSISLFQGRYEIKPETREVLLLPDRRQAIETVSVLLLHYLIGRSKNGYEPAGEWISIKETYGGKLFCSNFSRRAIRPLAERFSQDPEGLVKILLEDFAGRMVEGADVAVEVEAFPGVHVRILFWKSDEDLPADATMLFDRALAQILTMEDLTVLLTILADDVLEGVKQASG